MAGIVRADPNADDNATRLVPGDETVVAEALDRMRAGDPTALDALTPSQVELVRRIIQTEGLGTPEQAEGLGTPEQSMGRPPVQPGATSPYPIAPVPTVADQAAAAGSLTAEEIRILASMGRQYGTALNLPQADPDVLRKHAPSAESLFRRGNLPRGPADMPAVAPLSKYSGEYPEKLSDAAFRDWMTRRATVLKGMDPTEAGRGLLSQGFDLWNLAGQMVAMNPVLQRTLKPEEWLEQRYIEAGGDAMYEKFAAEAAKSAAERSPITTTTSTQTYRITAAQAQGIADEMSRNLLGRMASDAELKKARGAMQKLLTATVQTSTTDATDPANVRVTTSVKAGVQPQDAAAILEMRMRRSSEGMAFSAGKMFEDALAKMA